MFFKKVFMVHCAACGILVSWPGIEPGPCTAGKTLRPSHWAARKLPKSFCAYKDTIKKAKRQLIEWEKIFTNHIPDKGLISRIY